MKGRSSAFLPLTSNSLMSNERCLRSLMTFSTSAVEAVFSEMSKESAREVSSISAQLRYIAGPVIREEIVAVK